MKLFKLKVEYGEYCLFLRLANTPQVWGDEFFEGTPRKDDYPVPKGERDHDTEAGPLPDFTHFDLDPIPTFSARARDVLDDLLSPYGEFAAIEMDEPMRYFAFNTTTIVDVLDEARSEIARFRSGGVMAVDKHILLGSVTALPPIFKMPQTRRNTTYVNERFVAEVQRHRLSGFGFDLLFER
jgi:hypothetical protein